MEQVQKESALAVEKVFEECQDRLQEKEKEIQRLQGENKTCRNEFERERAISFKEQLKNWFEKKVHV